MSRGVDFIQTNLNNFQRIIRPDTFVQAKAEQSKPLVGTIKIEASFKPEHKSSINQALRPQIQKLKDQYKKHLAEEKKKSALLAQGKITRQEFAHKQPEIKGKDANQELRPEDQVTVDKGGQVRDKHGNIQFVKNEAISLAINKEKIAKDQKQNLINNQKVKQSKKIARSFLDRNLLVGSSKKRIRRSMLGLQFLEKGSYQTTEKRAEMKKQVQNLSDVFAEQEDEAQIRVIKKRKKVNLQFNRDVPNVEWWDEPLLSGKKYLQIINASEETSLKEKENLVSEFNWMDPIDWNQIGSDCVFQKVGDSDENQRIILPMYLTKDEKKKAKRKRKHEKLLEKNDQIKLGLIEPDKPKLRVGNMAIVMKNQFILDPSKVEAEAKKQTDERVNKHLQMNSTRKLTKVQKKDKAIRKLKRDSAKQCRRAVFKLERLTQKTHDFKVNMNAKQLALNGFVIKPSNEVSHFPTMVLVEGGLRAIKMYKNLMLRRIHWEQSQPPNSCKLIWEGQIENSTSGKWKIHEVADEVEGLRLLTEKKLENFWEYMANT